MSEAWRAEFFRLWKNPDATTDEVHRAFQLKNANLPSLLYRYRSSGRIGELDHDSVWFSQPSGQNDPFDSFCSLSGEDIWRASVRRTTPKMLQLPSVTSRLSDEQRQHCLQCDDPMEALHEALIATAATPEEREQSIAVRDVLRNRRRELVERTAVSFRLMPQQHLRICCFTPNNQSTSMWEHYAEKHKGLCIAYDFSQFPPESMQRHWLYPVLYVDTPFDLTPFYIAQAERDARFPTWIILAGTHKSADWSSEREWRLIMPAEVNPAPGLELLAKPSAVYLGAEIDSDKQQHAEEIARRRNIPIFKMEVSRTEGRMFARPL